MLSRLRQDFVYVRTLKVVLIPMSSALSQPRMATTVSDTIRILNRLVNHPPSLVVHTHGKTEPPHLSSRGLADLGPL